MHSFAGIEDLSVKYIYAVNHAFTLWLSICKYIYAVNHAFTLWPYSNRSNFLRPYSYRSNSRMSPSLGPSLIGLTCNGLT